MTPGTRTIVATRHRPAPIRALIAGIGLALASATAGAAEPAGLLADFPRAHVILETAGIGCLGLDTYVAVTAEQRAQGLMYIRHLGEFEAMYFDYPEPATIVMWMQNTYVSLDMVFIRSDGRIAGIETATTPLSTDRIRSPEPVAGVLEVNAGFTERWRVRPGTRVLAVETLAD